MAGRRKDGKLPDPVNYSLWLLNYKPRSVKEMTLALKKRGFSDEVADETAASLIRWGYIDDERYKNYVIEKRKRSNPKGRDFVRRELKEAGIECGPELEDLYTDEEEQALIGKLLARWSRSGQTLGENRDRFYGRLYRRGFAPGNITAAMEDFPESDAEEEAPPFFD